MAVFISYSHVDSDFANALVRSLIERRVAVWFDRVEVRVGESLIEKIQGAISEADFLAIVLTKNSVESEWCKKELTAGLMRELGERRVVVLPILVEDCEIPLFLRDKRYADFRSSREDGLEEFLRTLAPMSSEHLARFDCDQYQSDFAHDWGIINDSFLATIEVVSFVKDEPYSVSSQITIEGNAEFTNRYKQYADVGLGFVGKNTAIAACKDIFDRDDAHVTLPDDRAVEMQQELYDPRSGMGFRVAIRARRLGRATGFSILYHFGAIFGDMLRYLVDNERSLTQSEKLSLARILSEHST